MRFATTTLLVGFILFGFGFSTCYAQSNSPTSYWPSGVEFESSVPTPKQHFGFEVGTYHLRHDQLADYVRTLAEKSDRFKLIQYGKTHGGRPLLLAIVTSPSNHSRLQQLRRSHVQLTDHQSSSQVELDNVPVVINMGYGVHGDEPSASNSAALVAHYLAAAKGDQIEKMLDNMVILLDPCLNPDGFDRFARWVNRYRGKVPNADPAHAEHNQGWPRGRTNYYWFDLNRDWLPLVHPESRARMRWYHQWKPDVVLDFHEMGSESTYFFQPGIPERTNPLTPKRNVELTNKIAKYHAEVLDADGKLYMTKELFDDFYMGKGSTYPDLHGAVGILFEQAGADGHIKENQFGKLRFYDSISNQFKTSLSSLNATHEMKKELLEFKRTFYNSAAQMAKRNQTKTIVFTSASNRSRLQSLAEMLLRHDIKCFWPVDTVQYGDHSFSNRDSLIVPVDQKEFRFLQSLLDRRTSFQENIFYDVSSWSVPYAFGVNEHALKNEIPNEQLVAAKVGQNVATNIEFSDADIAYLVDWRDDRASKLLVQLLRQGIKVQVAQKPFTVKLKGQQKRFGYGTLSVFLGIQDDGNPGQRTKNQIKRILNRAANQGAEITPVKTALTPVGIDLGSGSFPVVNQPDVAMLIGPGNSQYRTGEIWHLFDNELRFPVTLIKSDMVPRVDLSRYEKLILAGPIDEFEAETIGDWIKNGGTLIAMGDALGSIDRLIVERELINREQPDEPETEHSQHQHLQRPFADRRTESALKQIAGAIFDTRIDTTHPLFYGFESNRLPVFRTSTARLSPSETPYRNPAIYPDTPLLAGYASDENVQRLANSASVTIEPVGRGQVIAMVDNPVFRGYFHGTKRLLINAVFFGHLSGRRGR